MGTGIGRRGGGMAGTGTGGTTGMGAWGQGHDKHKIRLFLVGGGGLQIM